MSPTSSQMQKVEPSRIVSWGKSTPGVPNRAALSKRLDDELVDVDVRRPGEHEDDAFGDVLGAERVKALVRRLRLLLVAAEAHTREVGLDEAGIDCAQPNWPAKQVFAEGVREPAHSELGSDVDGRVLVRLPPGDRAEVDDVPAVRDVRQAKPGHPHQAVDVRLEHGLLVFLSAFPERIAAEAEAGVVDEDLDRAELRNGVLQEALTTLRIGDVELLL